MIIHNVVQSQYEWDKIKIVILGTFPGIESLNEKRFYQSNRNSFWKIMEGVLNEKDLEKNAKNPTRYNDEAMNVFKKHGIALLDLYECCEREDKNSKNTSLDKHIKNAKINEELANIPQTVKVLCNGAKAFRIYEKVARKTYSNLPESKKLQSSSNSNSKFVDKKIEEWKKYFK